MAGRRSRSLDPPSLGFVGASWAADDTLVYSSAQPFAARLGRGGGTPEPLMPESRAGWSPLPCCCRAGAPCCSHSFDGAARDRVAVLDLDTGEQKDLVEGGSNPTYADTGHLVFARGDDADGGAVRRRGARRDGRARRARAGRPAARPGGATDYALSATGTLAYVPGGAEAASGGRRVGRSDGQGHRARRARSHRRTRATRGCRPTASGCCS